MTEIARVANEAAYASQEASRGLQEARIESKKRQNQEQKCPMESNMSLQCSRFGGNH